MWRVVRQSSSLMVHKAQPHTQLKSATGVLCVVRCSLTFLQLLNITWLWMVLKTVSVQQSSDQAAHRRHKRMVSRPSVERHSVTQIQTQPDANTDATSFTLALTKSFVSTWRSWYVFCPVFHQKCVGTNLIHDFTAVTFSVKLVFFREKRLFLWNPWFFCEF